MAISQAVAYRAEFIAAALRAYHEAKYARLAAQRAVAPTSAPDFGNALDLTRAMTPEEVIRDKLRDPVRNTLRGLVREEAFKTLLQHGDDALHEMAEEAERLYPKGGAVLDKWLDGIGSWVA